MFQDARDGGNSHRSRVDSKLTIQFCRACATDKRRGRKNLLRRLIMVC
jgi:hypothetical protein